MDRPARRTEPGCGSGDRALGEALAPEESLALGQELERRPRPDRHERLQDHLGTEPSRKWAVDMFDPDAFVAGSWTVFTVGFGGCALGAWLWRERGRDMGDVVGA